MSIEKTKFIDQIIINKNNTISLKEVTIITENDNELSKTYHRSVLVPGQDVSNQPFKVVSVCQFLWTPQIISEYESQLLQ